MKMSVLFMSSCNGYKKRLCENLSNFDTKTKSAFMKVEIAQFLNGKMEGYILVTKRHCTKMAIWKQ